MLRSSSGREGFLSRGWTIACLNEDGKMPSDREKFMILMIVGPSSSKQSFKRKVGIESSSHCLFWEEKLRLWISVKVVGSKLDKFGGGMIGKRKGSGESDGENLERMRSILSLKNWRNELASDCVSGVSGRDATGIPDYRNSDRISWIRKNPESGEKVNPEHRQLLKMTEAKLN